MKWLWSSASPVHAFVSSPTVISILRRTNLPSSVTFFLHPGVTPYYCLLALSHQGRVEFTCCCCGCGDDGGGRSFAEQLVRLRPWWLQNQIELPTRNWLWLFLLDTQLSDFAFSIGVGGSCALDRAAHFLFVLFLIFPSSNCMTGCLF